jgi:hypothetical protein
MTRALRDSGGTAAAATASAQDNWQRTRSGDKTVSTAPVLGLDGRDCSLLRRVPSRLQAPARLTNHLYVVSRLRMCEATPPLPHTSSVVWCLIKHRNKFIFRFANKFSECAAVTMCFILQQLGGSYVCSL